MKFTIIFLLILLQASCSGHKTYCEHLQTLAESEDIRNSILRWVELNVKDGSTEHKNMWGVNGMMPADYVILDEKFDWSHLGFGDFSRISIIGTPEKIDSLVFTERSRYGLLIKISEDQNFGLSDWLSENIYKSTSHEISTFCMEGD